MKVSKNSNSLNIGFIKKQYDLIIILILVASLLVFLAYQHINAGTYDVDVFEKTATIFAGFAGSFLNLYLMLLLVNQHHESKKNQEVLDHENIIRDMITTTENLIDKFSINASIECGAYESNFDGSGNLGLSSLYRFANEFHHIANHNEENLTIFSKIHFNDKVLISFIKSVQDCLLEVPNHIEQNRQHLFYQFVETRLFHDIEEINTAALEWKKLRNSGHFANIDNYHLDNALELITELKSELKVLLSK